MPILEHGKKPTMELVVVGPISKGIDVINVMKDTQDMVVFNVQ